MHFCTEWRLRRHSFLALREPFPYTPVLTSHPHALPHPSPQCAVPPGRRRPRRLRPHRRRRDVLRGLRLPRLTQRRPKGQGDLRLRRRRAHELDFRPGFPQGPAAERNESRPAPLRPGHPLRRPQRSRAHEGRTDYGPRTVAPRDREGLGPEARRRELLRVDLRYAGHQGHLGLPLGRPPPLTQLHAGQGRARQLDALLLRQQPGHDQGRPAWSRRLRAPAPRRRPRPPARQVPHRRTAQAGLPQQGPVQGRRDGQQAEGQWPHQAPGHRRHGPYRRTEADAR